VPSPRRTATCVLVAAALLATAAPARPVRADPPPLPRSEDAAHLLVEAQLLLRAVEKEGDPRKIPPAVEFLDRAEAIDPSNAEVIVWRGIAAVMASDEAASRAAAKRLLVKTALGQREPRLHFLNALVALRFEDAPEEALQELRTAKILGGTDFMKGDPPSELYDRTAHRVLTALAVKFLNNGQGDAAVQALREAARLARDWPVEAIATRRFLAKAYERAGRFLESEEEWKSLVEQFPAVADFRVGYASVLAIQLRYEAAAKEFREALRLLDAGKVPPRDVAAVAEARMRLGNCLRHLGRLDEAKKELVRYRDERPEDGRGHYWLGILYFDALEQPAEALPHLEKARALLPYCDEPLKDLLRVYATAIPDAEKTRAIEKEIEEGAKARREERLRVSKERPNAGALCL
jgi:tetratricopeptide (TPR) repeat protein